ncbi:MAG: cysteine desulfurase NifS [Candidatus Omnitrophica bacterium CG1_02_49_10]|nr:MAG: cysteine desulfurase NifS [Candidatus Omnitrophica bacterium CG1_02_49_10]
MGRIIYIDNNATTPLHPEVLEAMRPFYGPVFGNPSSVYSKGREARLAIDDARDTVARFIGTESVDIVFTGSGSESNNIAIKGICYRYIGEGKRVITSSVEHPSVLNVCKHLESLGFDVVYLPVDEKGVVGLDALEGAINDKTVLVTIMHANNEIGTIQPIEEISKIVKEKGVTFHTDAVQSFGKIPVGVDALGVDMLSASAHKICGPKGVGMLYIRKGRELTPLIHGGHHERGIRAGTENVAGIAGFAKAVELVRLNMVKEAARRRALVDMLYKGLIRSVKNIRLNGHPDPAKRLPGTLNVSFGNIEGEALMLEFDLKGICASTGSACSSGTLEPSHVLTAIALSAQSARSSVRFSVGARNSRADIAYCLKNIPPIVEKLRRISPFSD